MRFKEKLPMIALFYALGGVIAGWSFFLGWLGWAALVGW
jgi:hypothetical protein